MTISIIVGIGKNREIGFKNQLLWRLSEDLKNFKKITMGHCIIMGRKTYESIGRPLPGRTNIVITRQKDFLREGIEVVHSLDEAIELSKKKNDDEAMVIGGEAIYKLALPLATKIYLSKISFEGEADAFFPPYNPENWDVFKSSSFEADGANPSWEFLEMTRSTHE
jgi:dihydrofolate reductase